MNIYICISFYKVQYIFMVRAFLKNPSPKCCFFCLHSFLPIWSFCQFPPQARFHTSSQTLRFFRLLLVLHQRAAEHILRKVISTLLHIHNLAETHNWLVLQWLIDRGESNAISRTQKAWSILLSLSPGHGWLWHRQNSISWSPVIGWRMGPAGSQALVGLSFAILHSVTWKWRHKKNNYNMLHVGFHNKSPFFQLQSVFCSLASKTFRGWGVVGWCLCPEGNQSWVTLLLLIFLLPMNPACSDSLKSSNVHLSG